MEEINYNEAITKEWGSKHSGALQVPQTLVGIVAGFADWIGLGNEVRNLFEDLPKNRALQKAKNAITQRVNELLAKNQIELDQLEKRLSDLQSSGFSLTGIALKKFHDETEAARKARDEAYKISEKNKIALTQAQSDADLLTANPAEFQDVADQYETATKILNKLGGSSNA